jgi:hypothetical protein
MKSRILVLSLLTFIVTACGSFLFPSCTYSVNLAHTEGTASDLIDEDQTPTAKTSLSVPISAVPSPIKGGANAVKKGF